MRRSTNGSTWVWRRVVACLLAYALALQGIGYALASAQFIGQITDDSNSLGVQLCRGDANSAESSGNTPHNPSADYHCIYCIAGGSHLLCARPSHLGFVPVAFVAIAWPFAPWQISTLNVYASSRARGPPIAA